METLGLSGIKDRQDNEEDYREYSKIAIVDDKIISKWIDVLGFDSENEAILRENLFTDKFKKLLGDTLTTAGRAKDFEIFDSDVLLYN